MRELLAGLVPGLPDAAVDVIVKRAAGFPLYAVETVRMLVAEGRLEEEAGAYRPVGDLTDLAVPETLIALIGSRLDALPPEARSLLQAAAVLGQSFTFDALSSVASIGPGAIEEHLRTLVRRELLTLEIDPRSPERGQHSFVQALIREVAYSTLSKRDRKARHLAAARFFEGLGSDELAGALAGHYLAAYRNAPEGPEADALAGQARIALRAAGQRAFDLGSMQQAVGFYDQAREITDDEAEAADLLERAGMAAFEGGRDELAETRIKDALEVRRRTGDPGAVARATALFGRVLTTHLRPEAAIALLEPAVRDLEPSGGLDEPTVQILAELSRAYYFNEEHARAVELADRALAAAERLDLVAIVCDLLVNRGTALLNLGRSYEGSGAIQAGLELAEQHGLTTTVLRAQVNLGISHAASDPRKALETARAALTVATRLGRRSFVRTLMMNVGSAALDVGDWDGAVQELEAFRDEEADEAGAKFARWTLVSFAALTGEDVEAEVDDLAAWAATIGEDGAEVAVQGLRAEVAFSRGRLQEAIDGWMANARGDALNAPSSYYHAGIAALLLGDRARAAEALDALEGTGAHGSFVAAHRRLIAGGISALDGHHAEALGEFRAALGAYRDLGVEWRFALGVVVIATIIGIGEPDIREAADAARAILVRLGAKPALALLDAAMTTEPAVKAPAEVGRRTATPAG
jgi:tetratricopeptide (TPR) repeat protein